MAGNVYSIGVYMTLHDKVSAGLAAMAGHLTGINHLLIHSHGHLRRFQQAAVGAGMAFVGTKMFSGMKHMLDHGGEMLRLQNQMIAGGWSQAEIAGATAKAWELSAKYQSISVEKIVEMQKEMAPVLGDRHHALEIAEIMTKMEVSMQGQLGTEKASSFTKQIRDAIRAAELAGEALKPERFQHYLDKMTGVLNAFGGTLMPSDFFMVQKYARAAGLNFDETFMWGTLPTVMQELGSASTGTAMMTMYSALVGGRMTARALRGWDELGLIDHSKVDLDKMGRPKRFKPGALIGTDTFMHDPYKFINDVVLPAAIGKGRLTEEMLAEIRKGNLKEGAGAEGRKAISKLMAELFGDRTAQGMADILALQFAKVERDRRILAGGKGIDDGAKLFGGEDYKIALEGVTVQWNNLMTALASPNIKDATKAIWGLSDGLAKAAKGLAGNPEVAKALMIGIGSLAAGLIVVGIPILLAAMFGVGGLIVAGITALVIFIVTALITDLGKVRSWIVGKVKEIGKAIADGAMKAGQFAAQLAKDIGSALMSIPGRVAGAVAAMAAGIASAIGSAISGLASRIGGALGFKGGGSGTAGAPSTMEGFQPQSFTPPPSGGKMIQANLRVDLDGHQIARSVTRHIVDEGSHVGGPATYDGVMHPTPVDLVEA